MGLFNELRGGRICIDTAPFICLSGMRPQSRTTELGTFGTNVPHSSFIVRRGQVGEKTKY